MNKKILALLLVGIFMASQAFADLSLDFSILTDAELQYLIEGANSELDKRRAVTSPSSMLAFPGVWVDSDGFKVTIEDIYLEYGMLFSIDILVENNTGYDVEVDFTIRSINDWSFEFGETSALDVMARKKGKAQLQFIEPIDVAGLKSIDELESIDFEISIWDKGRSHYCLYRTGTLTKRFR